MLELKNIVLTDSIEGFNSRLKKEQKKIRSGWEQKGKRIKN